VINLIEFLNLVIIHPFSATYSGPDHDNVIYYVIRNCSYKLNENQSKEKNLMIPNDIIVGHNNPIGFQSHCTLVIWLV